MAGNSLARSREAPPAKARKKNGRAAKPTTKKSAVKKNGSAAASPKAKPIVKGGRGRKLSNANKTAVKSTKNGPQKNSKAVSNELQAKRPPKFSYVVEGLLAGQGRPTLPGHLKFLEDEGFRYIVTLTLNKPRALQQYTGNILEWVHIPIQDETPPTIDQMKQFVEAVDLAKAKKTKISAHCAWGRGRTGTMCACYLVHSEGLSADEAIEEIRKLRPGSIDTDKQINAVKLFAENCRS